ncbi:MAG TPA: acyltransferase [Bryobacteraceae bacterium]|jgi:peptidoglycan/LPS O-acetylase OafA/YrhL|nr:acyltransferase [Bryobacteraceae bacterium]
MITSKPLRATAVPAVRTTNYNYGIGYLRGFIVALVVAHHAVLAYHPFAPPPPVSLLPQPRWWQAFPIVDPQRWTGFSLFAGFNDIFFMSLMFFLSGLFVWHSLQAKGSAKFLRGRLLRLGVPFLVAAAIVAPLAYYPTYLQTSGHAGFTGFWHQWLSLGTWPAGPAWFVWVLLAFDCIAALLFVMAPRWGATLGRMMSGAAARPAAFFLLLAAISAITYIPMALAVTPMDWWAFGPFTFQTSRIFHYLAYFLIAVGIGALGIDRGLLALGGKLARRWPVWATAALVFFGVACVVTIIGVTSHIKSQGWAVARDAGFVLSCAASCFAFLALFIRFAQSRSRLFDSLADNSYAIYLVHYPFVSWLQYSLLPASLPAVAKGAIVFVGALGMSWIAAMAVRRIPAVARVV